MELTATSINQSINQSKDKKLTFYFTVGAKLIKTQNNPHDHTRSCAKKISLIG
jgi:hypothetical protein